MKGAGYGNANITHFSDPPSHSGDSHPIKSWWQLESEGTHPGPTRAHYVEV